MLIFEANMVQLTQRKQAQDSDLRPALCTRSSFFISSIDYSLFVLMNQLIQLKEVRPKKGVTPTFRHSSFSTMFITS